MAEQPIQVDVQVSGQDVPAGRLWTHRHGQSESATFSYLESFLQRADGYEQSTSARELAISRRW
jgi:hypothetical protein